MKDTNSTLAKRKLDSLDVTEPGPGEQPDATPSRFRHQRNSHKIMMDTNNQQIADIILESLATLKK